VLRNKLFALKIKQQTNRPLNVAIKRTIKMNKDQADQHSGTTRPEIIPAPISDYIKNNFREDFLTDIYTLKDKNGKTFYRVDVSHNNTLHHLKFDAMGTLILQEAEPLMELFDDDDYTEED